jgi:hypothetical protein
MSVNEIGWRDLMWLELVPDNIPRRVLVLAVSNF